MDIDNYNKIDGDVGVAFENNHILHRQWSIKIDSIYQCHVLPMVVIFYIDSAGQLQSRVDCKPGNWMQQNSVKLQEIKFVDEIRDAKNTHYKQHIYPFLTNMI